MFITTNNEIISLMPTAKWSRPEMLLGYLEEEERVTLEPLLGASLYRYLLSEYDRLHAEYGDITATTVSPDGYAKQDPSLPHASVTNALEAAAAHSSGKPYPGSGFCSPAQGGFEVPEKDQALIQLIRICQQIEFYKMLAHKSGMLGISFNGGSGFAQVSAEGYDAATKEQIDHLIKDAFMSASRSIDSLLIYLEADAKGDRLFTEQWMDADAFYLHTDLLFSTAKQMNEYLSAIKSRMEYVEVVPTIRYVQRMMIAPKVGPKFLALLLKAERDCNEEADYWTIKDTVEEILSLLRQAAAFYVEARRPKLARQDSNLDGDRVFGMAISTIEESLPLLGNLAENTPIYNKARARKEEEEQKEARRRIACETPSKPRQTGSLFSLGMDVTSKWVPEQKE